ncbi:AAA family ATPase [Aminobacter sp. HY435]|uniref:AAA family ATPase n=1 Tax=Aminobacter sp. HY435 TaxID=2970917 RepID=UPI0022B94FEE|nr:AAA family ATPase [Aminobacter sp. HY435]
MDRDCDRFFVLTGGPGSGKTTLIAALAGAGHATSVEAGRGIIQNQVAIDGPALPWRDRALFAELMLSWEMRSHAVAQATPGPVYFDRGVPDVVGYLRLSKITVPGHVEQAARQFRYNPMVFMLPYWPEIFTQDSERKQHHDEARRTHEAMVETYTGLGYQLLEVPIAPVEERLAFVLDHSRL